MFWTEKQENKHEKTRTLQKLMQKMSKLHSFDLFMVAALKIQLKKGYGNKSKTRRGLNKCLTQQNKEINEENMSLKKINVKI